MKNWALAAMFIGAIGVSACGGDDDGKGPVTIVDGGGTDAMADSRCDPVAQMGCDAGEKCGIIVEGSQEDPIFRTTCLPEGTVAVGGACMRTEGVDNCLGGAECFSGICTPSCKSMGDVGCNADQACTLYSNVFTEYTGDNAVGICEAQCDPLSSNIIVGGEVSDTACPTEGSTCVPTLFSNTGRGVCAPAQEGFQQDDECSSAPGGGCFLNGCDAGYTAMPFAENPFGAGENWCLGMCKPVDTYIGAMPDQPTGDPAFPDCARAGVVTGGNGPYGCRFISFFDSTVIPTPDTFGVCFAAGLALADFGDCTTFDWATFVEANNGDGVDDVPFYCTGGVEGGEFDRSRCPSGCVSQETIDAALPTPEATARAKRDLTHLYREHQAQTSLELSMR